MSNESCPVKEQFKTMIGGQALIEGIMMRGPESQAIVVRSPKEGLVEKLDPLKKKTGILTWPMIRGIVNFGGSMISGVKSLMWSAEKADLDDGQTNEEPSKLDQWLEKKLGSEKFMSVVVTFAVTSAGRAFRARTGISGVRAGRRGKKAPRRKRDPCRCRCREAS